MPYEKRQRVGIFYSALLHALVLIFAIFGLPHLFSPQSVPEPMALVVDILPVADITNVPSAENPQEKPEEKKEEKKEEPKPEPPKPEEAKPSKLPVPPVTQEPPPPPPPPEEKPEPQKKEPEPTPPKPPEEKKPEKKQKPEDLDAILKSVKETAQKEEPKPAESPDKKSASDAKSKHSQIFDPTLALSVSEKNAIRSQIERNWTVPAGARDAHELVVILNIELEKDGSVIKVDLSADQRARYAQDSFFRAAADSAIRAVRRSSPLKNLSPEKYGSWRHIELAFDPKEQLY